MNIDIPANINSVLIARIDRLTNDLKETAQIASVLGREFDIQILLELISIIDAKIEKKELNELIYQGENEKLWFPLSEIKYIFKHALLRDAIYEMQLKQRLRFLHKLAGEVMEELYGDNEKLYQDFAYHFEKAGVIDKTKMYLEKSGDYLSKNFKNEEALKTYDQLLPLSSTTEQKLETYYKKAKIFEVIARWNDSIEMLQTGIQLALETSNMKKEIDLKIKLGRVLERKSNYNEGLLVLRSVKEYLESGENLSSLENQLHYSTCIDFIGIILYRQGHFDDALKHYKKSLSIAKKVGNKRRIASSLNGIGGILFNQGNYNEGLEAYQKSLKLKEELGDKIGIGISLNNIGLVYYHLGNFNEGLKFENKSLELYREVGAKDYMGYNYAYISWAYIKIEEFKLALSIALLHLKNIVEIGTYAEKGRTHLAIALVLIKRSQLDEESKVILDEITDLTNLKPIPETYFEYAIKISSEDNYLETLVPTLYEYGKFLCETGRKDEGREKLKLAKIKAAEGGMKGELKKLKELENLC
ncbi:tetratricopeptide repeat protein [Candidatus Dependentiae bacterium]|nr:tetratricopeptide repeat protein [Candidatus Dependentiae bacterium]